MLIWYCIKVKIFEYRRLYNYFNFGFDKTDSHYISLLKKRQKNHILEWYKRKSRSTLIGLALFPTGSCTVPSVSEGAGSSITLHLFSMSS